jgi:hypothetical protein
MGSVNTSSLQHLAKIIKVFNEFRPTEDTVGSEANVKRIDTAYKNVINVIFSCGYEIDYHSRRLIKSKNKRKLL